jgi:hypothetical protein
MLYGDKYIPLLAIFEKEQVHEPSSIAESGQ